jgi:hypothetical protein
LLQSDGNNTGRKNAAGNPQQRMICINDRERQINLGF